MSKQKVRRFRDNDDVDFRTERRLAEIGREIRDNQAAIERFGVESWEAACAEREIRNLRKQIAKINRGY